MVKGNVVPSITAAEHIGPADTGDNIEAKRSAGYVWNAATSQWERQKNNIQIGDSDVSALNPVPITGNVTASGASLAVAEALNFTAYNLNSAAYSGTTVISNDYILSGLELHFSTNQSRTITLTTEDGTVLFKDTGVTYLDRTVGFDRKYFNGGEDLTLSITQTTGACTVTGKLTIAQGELALSGNPQVEQATVFDTRSLSQFYNFRGQRHIATTGYITQTANTAGELIAAFRNPSDSGVYVLFDKSEFGSDANTRFSRLGGGTITLSGTPTRRPIAKTNGEASSSVMEIYTAGKTSPQFTVNAAGTLRKVAFMQAYEQYKLTDMEGTSVVKPGQTIYWTVDEPTGGGGSDYHTCIDFEWIEIPTATWNSMVTALQAKVEY